MSINPKNIDFFMGYEKMAMMNKKRSVNEVEMQPISDAALLKALEKRGQSLASLAKTLEVSNSSFHRWVTADRELPHHLVWKIGNILDLEKDELDRILLVPQYKVFFRRRFLTEVPQKTAENAIDLAKAFLNLSTLHSKSSFAPPDLSQINDPSAVAEHIRRYFKFSVPISFKQMITQLRESGVEVGFIGFSSVCEGIESNNDETKEDAFSVTDENRFCIFCNTESINSAKLPFVVAHELSHIFRWRAEIDKNEERFCNEVAGEIVHPRSYFLENQERISSTLASGDKQAMIGLIDQIVDDLGGEFWGVALRLHQLGFLKPNSRFLIAIGRERSQKMANIDSLFFSSARSKNVTTLSEFWDDSRLLSHPVFHFYKIMKRGIQEDRMTSRAFAKMFRMEFGQVENLARTWRALFRKELELTND